MRSEVASLTPFTQNRQNALNRCQGLCNLPELSKLQYLLLLIRRTVGLPGRFRSATMPTTLESQPVTVNGASFPDLKSCVQR